MFFVNNPTVMALKKDLDVGMLRQRVIADNVANVNTPGFKKSHVSFEEQFKTALGRRRLALRTSHPLHLGGVKHPAQAEAKTVQVTNTASQPDGNNVNIDEEMVNLAANQMKYQTSTQALDGYYSLVSHIISSSRR
ncbi:flagellar basal body rod protein FlgB [Desulfofalx alkaliphila]|uniref:flagellar basal body rod protein FlgB n=1 Tax=Desulfofalx alkaliphila TaxID=105483 RepID=UPI000A75C6ED|nr:flagellar basal body rod protein FlgB [Desulfofalx alkaliphila]